LEYVESEVRQLSTTLLDTQPTAGFGRWVELDVCLTEEQMFDIVDWQERIGGITVIRRMPTNCGDDTCPSCVIAGDFIFLAHHAGGHQTNDIVFQMEASFDSLRQTLASVGASLDDVVQINLYLKNTADFQAARDVFYKYFKNGFPARMTSTTDFISPACLCMLDAIAYKPGNGDVSTDHSR